MIYLSVFHASLASTPACNRRMAAIAGCAAVLLASAGPTLAQDPTGHPLIATVDRVEIRQSDLALAEQDMGRNVPTDDERKREYLLTYLSDMILLAGAAEKEKVVDEAELRRRITFARNKALMDMLLQNAAKTA